MAETLQNDQKNVLALKDGADIISEEYLVKKAVIEADFRRQGELYFLLNEKTRSTPSLNSKLKMDFNSNELERNNENLCLGVAGCSFSTSVQEIGMHGGAGNINRSTIEPEKEKEVIEIEEDVDNIPFIELNQTYFEELPEESRRVNEAIAETLTGGTCFGWEKSSYLKKPTYVRKMAKGWIESFINYEMVDSKEKFEKLRKKHRCKSTSSSTSPEKEKHDSKEPKITKYTPFHRREDKDIDCNFEEIEDALLKVYQLQIQKVLEEDSMAEVEVNSNSTFLSIVVEDVNSNSTSIYPDSPISEFYYLSENDELARIEIPVIVIPGYQKVLSWLNSIPKGQGNVDPMMSQPLYVDCGEVSTSELGTIKMPSELLLCEDRVGNILRADVSDGSTS